MSHSKPISKAKGRRRAVTALGVAGALSLAGGASASIATGGIATQNTAPVILAEEEISDVSLATFYVFDKENAGSSRHGVRLACGCWTGTYYTSGNDAYAPSPRPLGHAIAPKRVSKTPQQARPGSTTHLALRKTSR
jgi:hypothetical protein